jgi:uncharacterized protein YkwD
MKWLFATVFILLACKVKGNIRRQTFRAHKQYRALHGLAQLSWNTTIADFAQDWCGQLAKNDSFKHSEGSGYGENLYKATGANSATYAGWKAVTDWYEEINDYDYSNPVFSSETGHFTQVMKHNLC